MLIQSSRCEREGEQVEILEILEKCDTAQRILLDVYGVSLFHLKRLTGSINLLSTVHINDNCNA